MPSSSSGDGDGDRHTTTKMTDSNVLRLVQIYDPKGSSAEILKARRSLDNTRDAWHSVGSKSISSLPSGVSSASCSVLSQQRLISSQDNIKPSKSSTTPRLQRQAAIHDQDPPSPPPPPPTTTTTTTITNVTNTFRPILKYIHPNAHNQSNVPPRKTEPLRVEIEPYVQPPPPPPPSSIVSPNEKAIPYQPLITTGAKRVCAAVSKSEWDLRLQHDAGSSIASPSPPPRPPSPRTNIIQQDDIRSYRPLFGRSKSSIGIHNIRKQDDNIDDFDENSLQNAVGSCVEKLKQIFSTNTPINKQHRVDSIESNIHRRLHTNETNTADLLSSSSSIIQKTSQTKTNDSPTRTIINSNLVKPTTIVQEAVPTLSPPARRPILKSQKTVDSTEILNHPNNNSKMPSSELSYDAYRFRRLNDQDQNQTTRLRNVAKVEPYSINSNMIRPLYQPSLSQSTTAVAPPKERNVLNSMGNTPINSSTSSSAGSLGGTIRHPNIRHSDFLVPNPIYSTSTSAPPPPPPPPSSSNITQPLSNSSSYATPSSTSMLLTESHRLPNTNNNVAFDGRSSNTTLLKTHSQQKHRVSNQGDLYSTKQIYSPSTYHNGNGTVVNNNNNKYEKNYNYTPPSSYHYRPRELASSTTAISAPLTNGRHQIHGPLRSTMMEQQQQQQPQQDERANGGQQQSSRRRFHRRKQMKRSKSADLYQDSLSKNQNINNHNFQSPVYDESNRLHRQPRSISRDLIGGGDGNLSSSSSSSSSSPSTANIERVNRAALLRYKSLDSMTFNNRKSNLNGKLNNQKALSKPSNIDYDSDDSVCGIPKPRKIMGR